MATNTSNFGLVKPAYSDTADIATINGNMDKIDTTQNALGAGLAIIANNNTHDAITSGQYVYVHGHGTLAEGLYKATTNIAANGTLSGSNLTAVSGGLGAQFASISNQIANLDVLLDPIRNTSGIDFNTMTTTGKWRGPSISQCSNIPSSVASMNVPYLLIVDKLDEYALQQLYVYKEGAKTLFFTRQQKWSSGGTLPFENWYEM